MSKALLMFFAMIFVWHSARADGIQRWFCATPDGFGRLTGGSNLCKIAANSDQNAGQICMYAATCSPVTPELLAFIAQQTHTPYDKLSDLEAYTIATEAARAKIIRQTVDMNVVCLGDKPDNQIPGLGHCPDVNRCIIEGNVLHHEDIPHSIIDPFSPAGLQTKPFRINN